MNGPRAAISWSGGKDSCAALMRVRRAFDVVSMITMVDDTAERSRSHGLRSAVLDRQAAALGVSRVVGRCSWDTYDAAFSDALGSVAAGGITHVVFGDIMFAEHRAWAEQQCRRHGLTAVEPLWGEPTALLFDEWIASGSEAIIVTARASLLDESWLGRRLAADMAPQFAQLGVDPCGERGEYHTFVTNSPLFREPIAVSEAGRVLRSGCWALDLVCDDAARG